MAKKRFGISADVNQGLTDIMQMEREHDSVYRNAIVPLARIQLDSENPRKHHITIKDLDTGLKKNDPLFADKQKEYDGLVDLSNSIKQEGLIHPIILYKDGTDYRLVAGERRYLASLIAQKKSIDARVFQTKPKGFHLKLVQWMENESRQDLPLLNRLENVQALMDVYQKEQGAEKLTALKLSEVLCVSRQTAQYFVSILKNTFVMDAVRVGKVKTLQLARELTRVNSEKELDDALNGEGLPKKQKKVKQIAVKASRAGRQRTKVALGTTKKTAVAKTIVQSVLHRPEYASEKDTFSDINWADFDSTTKAFANLVKLIEKKVK